MSLSTADLASCFLSASLSGAKMLIVETNNVPTAMIVRKRIMMN